jgi:glycosyltransferase involved in cell wall biosynthesis
LYIAHNLGALPAAAIAARRHGAALGFDAEDFHHGQFTDRRDREHARRIEKRYLPVCTYVSASSPGVAEAYADLCARPPIVLLNVFPLSSRPAQIETRAPGPLRLYWFSQTIGHDRGLEAAVRAIGILRDSPVELHVQGAWQPGFESALRQVAADAGVSANRVIHHPPGAPDEMVRVASRFDVGLALEPGHTPNSDLALSNKVFTYLLGGLPIVASATSAQAALCMQLGTAARVVPAGDANALAEAIRGWMDDPSSLEAAKQTAWRLGEARFNWDLEQRRFLDVVRQALRTAAPAVQPGPAVGELVS